ncbi:MAG: SIMPL domain-containing protein [Planctomycetia bacterium]|nr:SIMPL domain-containing protein [Planctomycetia bacterium]
MKSASLTLVVCLMSISGELSAQQPPAANTGVISVQGTAEITKVPEVIRVMIKQYGRGNDQESAKAALVAAEKKLMTRLNEAGVEVIVSHAGLAMSSQNLMNRYRNMASMLMQRQMAAGGGNGVPAEKQNLSYLERYLTIDLKPKNKTKEPLALLADLQERFRKDYQDVSGMTDALPKDDNNDNRNDMNHYRNDMSMFSNDVRFQIAARITREDRIKLYAEAMKKGKSLAQDLAQAAEMQLGGIQTISSNFSSVNNVYYTGGGSMRYVNSSGETARFPFNLKEDGSESVAVRDATSNYQNATLEPLIYQISLNISFKLEPSK